MRRAQGQIIARGKNTWLVRTFAGRDGNDRRQYHSRTIHGTKAEAQRYLTDELTGNETTIAEITGYLRRLPAAKLRLLKELFKLDAKYYRSTRIKR